MTLRRFGLFVSLILLLAAARGLAQDGQTPPREDTPPAAADGPLDVEKLVEQVRDSVVVVTFTGRDGSRRGLGTGFIISPDGLIATNLHVIGEARPITVQLADGTKHEVTEVYASERALDLAVVRIDAKDLPALELGDSETLKQGQPVVAVGNPLGLERSVVSGLVSGRREIDGKPMIQLAIPIEPGNSGGPLLDREGRVHGLLTMKSLVSDNLGFAVEINALKPLLEKPNPVAMSRWLTIGTLDPNEWTEYLGARWRQRAGRILVDGLGTGFGGRSFCLAATDVPELPYEVAVTVRLDNEAGAAGLLFSADGQRHYGFYPTGGSLRLTRFEGPNVLSWTILETKPSKHYRQGDWNTLKVRVEKDKLLCYVNDQLAIESRDTVIREGKVGLAKFRHTQAEFKGLRVAKSIPPDEPPQEVVDRVVQLVEDLPAEGPVERYIEDLLPEAEAGVAVLRKRAQLLEKQADQLRLLAAQVHRQRVVEQLAKVMQVDEEKIDLIHAGLLIARLDNDELDVEAYRKEVERLARQVAGRIGEEADEAKKIDVLNTVLFKEAGYHGSRTNYYHRSNSYLNEVLDDREGLPIALSVLYMELGRRVGLNVVGVGLPGHFVVKHVPAEGGEQLIDPFNGGKRLSREDAAQLVRQSSEATLRDEHLQAASPQAIVTRMLYNLLGLAQRDRDVPRMLGYLDALIAVNPEAGNERGMRAVLYFQTKRYESALRDIEWLLDHRPEGVSLDSVRSLREAVEEGQRRAE